MLKSQGDLTCDRKNSSSCMLVGLCFYLSHPILSVFKTAFQPCTPAMRHTLNCTWESCLRVPEGCKHVCFLLGSQGKFQHRGVCLFLLSKSFLPEQMTRKRKLEGGFPMDLVAVLKVCVCVCCSLPCFPVLRRQSNSTSII